MSPVIIYFFVFASVSAAVALMCLLFSQDESLVQARLSELNNDLHLDGPMPKLSAGRSLADSLKEGLLRLGSLFQPAKSSPNSQRLRFIRAGIYAPSAPSYMTATRLLMMIVPVAAGLAAVTVYKIDIRPMLIGAAPAGLCGMLLPAIWLRRKTKKRQMLLLRTLPDFLDVMVVCLESGMSAESAFQRTKEELEEAHPMLCAELGIVEREITLGKTIEDALEGFAFRADLDVVQILATNVRQSRKLGIRMADNLRTHADILRTQREYRAEEQAQKAAVKVLLPTLLFIFPAIFVVLVGPAAFQIKDSFAKQRNTDVVVSGESMPMPYEAAVD